MKLPLLFSFFLLFNVLSATVVKATDIKIGDEVETLGLCSSLEVIADIANKTAISFSKAVEAFWAYVETEECVFLGQAYIFFVTGIYGSFDNQEGESFDILGISARKGAKEVGYVIRKVESTEKSNKGI
jgi:hypothetical protein